MKAALSKSIQLSQSRQLWIILAVSVILQVLITLFARQPVPYDTQSYLDAARLLRGGEIDIFRTPVYPALIAAAQYIAGDMALQAVVLFQTFVFYVSVVCLYGICVSLRLSRIWVLLTTCAYAFCPEILRFNALVLTEPLAVSGCVFLTAAYIRFMRRADWGSFAGVLFMLIFLIFLRPSFSYIPIVLTVIGVWCLCRRRYRCGAGLVAAVVIGVVMLLGYCRMVEKRCGVFTPSVVSVINQCTQAQKIKLITFGELLVKEQQWRQEVGEENADGYIAGVSCQVVDRTLTHFKSNPIAWYWPLIKYNFPGFISSPVIVIGGIGIFLTFGQLCLIMLLMVGGIVWRAAHAGRVNLMAVFLWMMCAGNLVVIYLGTYNAWDRLFLPSYTLFILMCAVAGNRFRLTYKSVTCDDEQSVAKQGEIG
ncbi:MAG: hypothetical protein K2L97_06075 [Muribaculaceae bacterium]|nr:hypothetical protein [Muribaculaceae bacterium]